MCSEEDKKIYFHVKTITTHHFNQCRKISIFEINSMSKFPGTILLCLILL